MAVPVRNYLRARRDRALGSIMGYAEREVFPSLNPAQKAAFRNVVLDSLNSYHDSALDLFKSDEGQLRNDALVDVLERLEQHLGNG